MVFTSPAWVPQMPIDAPRSIGIAEFMSNDAYGRYPLQKARNPFTCGISGSGHSATEVIEREKLMSRAIFNRCEMQTSGTEWDRVVAVFSLNTIDYVPVVHAVHWLSGIVTPVNPAASAKELEAQLRSSQAKAIFTCMQLWDTAQWAAKAAGISEDKIFILPMSSDAASAKAVTTNQLAEEGKQLPEKVSDEWSNDQGTRQVAFLIYSSGTSGLPKAVMISHYNVIANIIQLSTYESYYRQQAGIDSQTTLGLLPFSHAYGLVVMAHVAPYRGDEVIVLPKYNLETLLATVQNFKIEQINIAPPIIVQMVAEKEKCRAYDLSSIRFVYTGGAPLARETMEELFSQHPSWHVGQIYGLTETAVCVSSTSESDMVAGSAGSLLPGITAKIVNAEGEEIKSYETPGELIVQGPSIALGYLNNRAATEETFIWDQQGRWMRTGDEAVVRLSANGHEHIFIIDRIKELIKVKGLQVAPAELEAHLLTHPMVADCAVIQVPHVRNGEGPKAFIVKSPSCNGVAEDEIKEQVSKHVELHKPNYKWLTGGVEFLDTIPKSPTGKILRRILRNRERRPREAKL